MPALCSVLGTGDDEPVSIEVLKALYTIIAPDGSGEMDISCSAPDWLGHIALQVNQGDRHAST